MKKVICGIDINRAGQYRVSGYHKTPVQIRSAPQAQKRTQKTTDFFPQWEKAERQKGKFIMKQIDKKLLQRSAAKSLTRTVLSANADEIKTPEFIKECEKHKGLTISRMDKVVTEPDEDGVINSWYAVTFVELPNKYYNGGYSMTKLAEHLQNALCETDEERENFADFDLSEYELKVTARETKTKKGQPFVEVSLL